MPPFNAAHKSFARMRCIIAGGFSLAVSKQAKGSPIRDPPTRRLTANVPHGLFG